MVRPGSEHGERQHALAQQRGGHPQFRLRIAVARTLQEQSFPVDCSISRVPFKDEQLYTVVIRHMTERQAPARGGRA
jgi:hypothetical protein